MQGKEVFSGRVIHASELSTDNLHLARGKRVVVCGAGKSALDASVAAAQVATSVTNVFRQVILPAGGLCMITLIAVSCGQLQPAVPVSGLLATALYSTDCGSTMWSPPAAALVGASVSTWSSQSRPRRLLSPGLLPGAHPLLQHKGPLGCLACPAQAHQVGNLASHGGHLALAARVSSP